MTWSWPRRRRRRGSCRGTTKPSRPFDDEAKRQPVASGTDYVPLPPPPVLVAGSRCRQRVPGASFRRVLALIISRATVSRAPAAPPEPVVELGRDERYENRDPGVASLSRRCPGRSRFADDQRPQRVGHVGHFTCSRVRRDTRERPTAGVAASGIVPAASGRTLPRTPTPPAACWTPAVRPSPLDVTSPAAHRPGSVVRPFGVHRHAADHVVGARPDRDAVAGDVQAEAARTPGRCRGSATGRARRRGATGRGRRWGAASAPSWRRWPGRRRRGWPARPAGPRRA